MINPILSVFLLGGPELLILLAVALLGIGLLIAGAIFIIWHSQRKKRLATPPAVAQPPSAPTSALKECPRCHLRCAPDAPEGLCPQCLAQVALGTESTAPGTTINVNPLAEVAPGSRIPPDVAQLAAQFPQLEIIDLLGMGGMGMVYKARQPKLDRLVALKILPLDSQRQPSFAERFSREAKALARLNHPGIVVIYDFGQTSQYYYFVMEYVDGMNLRQLLQSQTLEPRQALELVTQICTALQYAHDESVVHRDIKPENILMTKKGQVKIADFGLAKLLGNAPDTALTMSQATMGTLNYMAPEQRQNAQGVDHRADIYSLGVVFYEMLTGEVPMGRFEPPSKKVQVDVRLDEVVLRALEREPARRYQQASEVKTDVESLGKTAAVKTAASSAGRPGIAYDFATPGSETAAERDAKKLRSFWLAAFGSWLLAWLFAAGMWDLGTIGGLIAATAIYCLIWWTLLKRLRFIPQLSAEAGRLFRMEYGFARRVFAGYLLTGIIHLMMVLVTLAILNAGFSTWEMLHWPAVATTSSAFALEHTGKEHRLLRNIRAFTDSIPNTELRLDSAGSAGWPGWTGVIAAVLIGFGFLQFPPFIVFGWARACFSWTHYWRPWLAFLTTMAGSGLLVFLAIFFYSSPSVQFPTASAMLSPQSRDIRSSLNVDAIRGTILECVLKAGYQPCGFDSFAFDSVPKGMPVARVQHLQYWKTSPFDRWRFTWRGMQRISPHFVVQLLWSEEPVETVISINAGTEYVIGRETNKDWQALLEAVEAALKIKETPPSLR